MAKVGFHKNIPGFIELRNSPAVRGLISLYAARAVDSASGFGGTYDYTVRTGPTRCRAYISTQDRHAIYANRKHNALMKALGSSFRSNQ